MFEQVDDASMAEIDQLFADVIAQLFFLNHIIILVDRSLFKGQLVYIDLGNLVFGGALHILAELL